MIFEHLTCKEGVQFVLDAGPNVAGTVTPQHLLVNRNAMLVGGIRPHFYWQAPADPNPNPNPSPNPNPNPNPNPDPDPKPNPKPKR